MNVSLTSEVWLIKTAYSQKIGLLYLYRANENEIQNQVR